MKALKIIVRTAAMCVLAATLFTSAALASSDKTEYGQVTSDDVNLRAEANTESCSGYTKKYHKKSDRR